MRSGLFRRQRWFPRSGEVRLLLLLSVVLTVVVLSNQFGILTPDTKPEMFLQPAQTAQRFALGWLDTPNLGSANYNTGTAAVSGLFAVLESFGLSAWLIGRVWRIALLLVAAWGARLLARDLLASSLNERGLAVAGVAAAVAYVANPYVIVGGGTTPTLQPYALLPWVVLCWLQGFRRPSWRWAVLAGLALALMGGINAGVVPVFQLVVLVPVVLHALVVEGRRFVPVVWLVLRTVLVYAALSAYWIVPALGAFGFASAVAEGTETVAAINMANSFPEVLRGLGMWTLYGQDGRGPFDPNRIEFLTSPLVVVLTFVPVMVAALGILLTRSTAHLFAVTSLLIGAMIMVGSFSTGSMSLWGRGVQWSLDSVPGMVAFRTTNKVGGVLELGLAILVAIAVAALSERVRSPRQKVAAVVAAGAVTAGSVAPALTGGLFWIPMDTPDYWFDAADEVNARGGDSRVLMVPGVGVPSYSWGYSGPDELGPSLFHRPFAFRSAALLGVEYSAALLGEVDRRLQNGTLPSGTLSVLSDYLGVGDIVGRYDLDPGAVNGQRIEDQLNNDPGLDAASVFGSGADANGAPGPVTVRKVKATGDAPSARARDAKGSLVVDGSGAALSALTQTGLVEHRPAVLLSGALDDTQLSAALDAGARLVLTDSNKRREWSTSNPTGVGPLQGPDEATRLTRGLFQPEEQTTSEIRGNASLTTAGEGMLFGPYEHTGVEQAFDGDRTTAWRFGNFGTGVGNSVTIVPERPLPLESVLFRPNQGGASWISKIRLDVTVGGRTVAEEVEVPTWRSLPTSVELPEGAISRIVIEVTEIGGYGDGAVGFAEIEIPGIRATRVVHTSDDLALRAGAAAEAAGAVLADIPIDVIFERELGDESGLTAEEQYLEREFSLPDERTFEPAGTFRLAAQTSDTTIDSLAGTAGRVTANSSSRLFNRPGARASEAIDFRRGGPDYSTGWSPNEPVVGEWLTLDFPERRLASFTLSQNEGGDLATRALISINDEEPFETELTAGFNWISLPRAQDAERIRILIAERSGLGFVRINHVGLPGLTSADNQSESPLDDGCVEIATLDGYTIRSDITPYREALVAGEPVPIEPCGPPIPLGAGDHRLSASDDFSLDLLHLASSDMRPPVPAAVVMERLEHTSDHMRVQLSEGCDACVLSSGQSFDPRWRASINGEDLGPPTVVDGFAAGWLARDVTPGSQVVMEFGPRGAVALGWWTSAIALAACLAYLALVSRRRSQEGRSRNG